MSPQPPPDWHPDPHDPARLRYWDGVRWTEHTAPAPVPHVADPFGAPPQVQPAEPGDRSPNSWQRRGKLGKAGIIGGGALVGLFAVGAMASEPEDDGSLATIAPVVVETTQTPETTEAPPDTEPPATEPPATTAETVAPPEPEAAPALVVARIVDGDTVDMSDGTTIRLIGIDTPEQGECGYQEAAETLGMIVYGQTVTLTPGARDDVDRYGRLLRYLDLSNGVDANHAMVEAGQAIARYDSRDGYGRHDRENAYVAADAATPAFCAPPPPPPEPVAAPAPAPTNVFYANCDAVRAAGAAPIYPGDPGWQPKFDRDKDGVGCE
jgi:endonuclease YncB( thermonuclease family)